MRQTAWQREEREREEDGSPLATGFNELKLNKGMQGAKGEHVDNCAFEKLSVCVCANSSSVKVIPKIPKCRRCHNYGVHRHWRRTDEDVITDKTFPRYTVNSR